MLAAPRLGRREVLVGPDGRRTALDYAAAVEFICGETFPWAEDIALVQDKFKTHSAASLFEAFPAEKPGRLAAKIGWHHTPQHGSWLNIAGIGISVLARAASRGRIPSPAMFEVAVAANTAERNADPRPVR